MVPGSLENVTAVCVGKTPSLHHLALLTFYSHKQVFLAHMENKQPGWMEEHFPDTPWVPVCPCCPHPSRQCLVGVTPLRGSLWNQKVTCATRTKLDKDLLPLKEAEAGACLTSCQSIPTTQRDRQGTCLNHQTQQADSSLQ